MYVGPSLRVSRVCLGEGRTFRPAVDPALLGEGLFTLIFHSKILFNIITCHMQLTVF